MQPSAAAARPRLGRATRARAAAAGPAARRAAGRRGRLRSRTAGSGRARGAARLRGAAAAVAAAARVTAALHHLTGCARLNVFAVTRPNDHDDRSVATTPAVVWVVPRAVAGVPAVAAVAVPVAVAVAVAQIAVTPAVTPVIAVIHGPGTRSRVEHLSRQLRRFVRVLDRKLSG